MSQERELIRRAQEGDPAALERLLELHLPSLRAFVRLNISALLRSREASCDLVQSVCRDLLRDLPVLDYRGEKSFRSWMYTAVLKKVRAHERRELAEKRNPAREVRQDTGCAELVDVYASVRTPSQCAIHNEELDRIDRAFERMPEDYRRVITLSRIAGLSHQEIAAEMARTPGAVKTLLNRAIVRLTRELDEP